ncbi:MAG: agmatine deiminase family protein [Phycisphaerales bacterium]|jgi:agmatine/peptidylarginine deiminase|nr:agmatine deiminase family protein [Phycisphaerales bacterium]
MYTTFLILIAFLTTDPYPEGSDVPRHLTEEESRLIARTPISPFRGVSSPPIGPIHCVAEYEPMDGILLAWEGSSSWKSILAKMAANITTIGEADAVIVVDTTSEQSSALSEISANGGDTDRVTFVVRATDTIWIRDYGPRYIYEGECRAIVDHTYNRPRPNDNALSSYLGSVVGHEVYDLPLVHGGGNFHLNAGGFGWATELISDENGGLSDAAIRAYWQDFQNLDVTITDAFPTSVDSTQHIDMWMCWASDTTCMISDWPYNSGSVQDVICDSTAATLQLLGYSVVRAPARSVSWTHYTYTNSVICNDLVLVPSYTNSSVSQHNSEAVAAWQSACPDKTIVQIPCESIVSAAGVMHCICMHIPRHLGGSAPTAHLQTPTGGQLFQAGQQVPVSWITDDDVSVTGVSLDLSTDGGTTWQPIASGLTNIGTYLWVVPDLATHEGKIRVTAFDTEGNAGENAGAGLFIINGTQVAGDVNGDGLVNVTDILQVMANWGPCGLSCPEDLDGDGVVGVSDLLLVVANW